MILAAYLKASKFSSCCFDCSVEPHCNFERKFQLKYYMIICRDLFFWARNSSDDFHIIWKRNVLLRDYVLTFCIGLKTTFYLSLPVYEHNSTSRQEKNEMADSLLQSYLQRCLKKCIAQYILLQDTCSLVSFPVSLIYSLSRP